MRYHRFDPYKEEDEKRGIELAKEYEDRRARGKNWALGPEHGRKCALSRYNTSSAKAKAKVTLAPVSFVKRGYQSE